MPEIKPKILIVEDDKTTALLFSKILHKEDYLSIIAEDGRKGLSKFLAFRPNAVIVDIFMPEMDGISLIKEIRALDRKVPIFVTTALVDEKVKKESYAAGANYFFSKPVDKNILIKRIELTIKNPIQPIVKEEKKQISSDFDFVGVGIAASTGGPLTLQNILKNLPYTEKAAIFVVLHAPDWMLESYAERLNHLLPYNVQIAKNGKIIEKGNIYLAPGNYHLRIRKLVKKLDLEQSELVNFVRPSADPLFKSIAESFGKNSIGIVLTGMGRDGAVGAAHISNVGGKILVQDPNTAIIHSMPSAVIDLGIADRIVPLENFHKIMFDTIESVYKQIKR